jgi:hypothetical protein
MQAVVLILESDNVADVKEQAICILANIADGDTAKSFIMSNEVGVHGEHLGLRSDELCLCKRPKC